MSRSSNSHLNCQRGGRNNPHSRGRSAGKQKRRGDLRYCQVNALQNGVQSSSPARNIWIHQEEQFRQLIDVDSQNLMWNFVKENCDNGNNVSQDVANNQLGLIANVLRICCSGQSNNTYGLEMDPAVLLQRYILERGLVNPVVNRFYGDNTTVRPFPAAYQNEPFEPNAAARQLNQEPQVCMQRLQPPGTQPMFSPPPPPVYRRPENSYRGRGGHCWSNPHYSVHDRDSSRYRRRRSHLDDIYLPNYDDNDEEIEDTAGHDVERYHDRRPYSRWSRCFSPPHKKEKRQQYLKNIPPSRAKPWVPPSRKTPVVAAKNECSVSVNCTLQETNSIGSKNSSQSSDDKHCSDTKVNEISALQNISETTAKKSNLANENINDVAKERDPAKDNVKDSDRAKDSSDDTECNASTSENCLLDSSDSKDILNNVLKDLKTDNALKENDEIVKSECATVPNPTETNNADKISDGESPDSKSVKADRMWKVTLSNISLDNVSSGSSAISLDLVSENSLNLQEDPKIPKTPPIESPSKIKTNLLPKSASSPKCSSPKPSGADILPLAETFEVNHPLPLYIPTWDSVLEANRTQYQNPYASIREIQSDEETVCFEDCIDVNKIDTKKSYLDELGPDDYSVVNMDISPTAISPKRKSDVAINTTASKRKKCNDKDVKISRVCKLRKFRSKSLSTEINTSIDKSYVLCKSKSVTHLNASEQKVTFTSELIVKPKPPVETIELDNLKIQQGTLGESILQAKHRAFDKNEPSSIGNNNRDSKGRDNKRHDYKRRRMMTEKDEAKNHSRGDGECKRSIVHESNRKSVEKRGSEIGETSTHSRKDKRSEEKQFKYDPRKEATTPMKITSRRTTYSDGNKLCYKKMISLFGDDSDTEMPTKNETKDAVGTSRAVKEQFREEVKKTPKHCSDARRNSSSTSDHRHYENKKDKEFKNAENKGLYKVKNLDPRQRRSSVPASMCGENQSSIAPGQTDSIEDDKNKLKKSTSRIEKRDQVMCKSKKGDVERKSSVVPNNEPTVKAGVKKTAPLDAISKGDIQKKTHQIAQIEGVLQINKDFSVDGSNSTNLECAKKESKLGRKVDRSVDKCNKCKPNQEMTKPTKCSDVSGKDHVLVNQTPKINILDVKLVSTHLPTRQKPDIKYAVIDNIHMFKCLRLVCAKFPARQRIKSSFVENDCCDEAVVLESPEVVSKDEIKIHAVALTDSDDVIEVRPNIPIIDLTEDVSEVKKEVPEIKPKMKLESDVNTASIASNAERITLYRSEETLNNSLDVQAMAASISVDVLNNQNKTVEDIKTDQVTTDTADGPNPVNDIDQSDITIPNESMRESDPSSKPPENIAGKVHFGAPNCTVHHFPQNTNSTEINAKSPPIPSASLPNFENTESPPVLQNAEVSEVPKDVLGQSTSIGNAIRSTNYQMPQTSTASIPIVHKAKVLKVTQEQSCSVKNTVSVIGTYTPTDLNTSNSNSGAPPPYPSSENASSACLSALSGLANSVPRSRNACTSITQRFPSNNDDSTSSTSSNKAQLSGDIGVGQNPRSQISQNVSRQTEFTFPNSTFTGSTNAECQINNPSRITSSIVQIPTSVAVQHSLVASPRWIHDNHTQNSQMPQNTKIRNTQSPRRTDPITLQSLLASSPAQSGHGTVPAKKITKRKSNAKKLLNSILNSNAMHGGGIIPVAEAQENQSLGHISSSEPLPLNSSRNVQVNQVQMTNGQHSLPIHQTPRTDYVDCGPLRPLHQFTGVQSLVKAGPGQNQQTLNREVSQLKSVLCYFLFYMNGLQSAHMAYCNAIYNMEKHYPHMVKMQLARFQTESIEKVIKLSENMIAQFRKFNFTSSISENNSLAIIDAITRYFEEKSVRVTRSWIIWLLEALTQPRIAEYLSIPCVNSMLQYVQKVANKLRMTSQRDQTATEPNRPALTEDQRRVLVDQIKRYQFIMSNQQKLIADEAKLEQQRLQAASQINQRSSNFVDLTDENGRLEGDSPSTSSSITQDAGINLNGTEETAASSKTTESGLNFKIQLPLTRPYDVVASPPRTTVAVTPAHVRGSVIQSSPLYRSQAHIQESTIINDSTAFITINHPQGSFSVRIDEDMLPELCDNPGGKSPVYAPMIAGMLLSSISSARTGSAGSANTHSWTGATGEEPASKEPSPEHDEVQESAGASPAKEEKKADEEISSHQVEAIETIDLTWCDDIDPEQLRNEIEILAVKKEEPQDDGNAEPANFDAEQFPVAPSPADSGISSPPLQVEYNEQVYSNRQCICGKSAEYLCGCKLAMYCSQECQKTDWMTHKELCLKECAKNKELNNA